MKLVVAVGGASGSVYARRLLDALVPLASTVEVG
jgi:3-polyprenyl-4-hydroxybenzoate decarboxylase